MRVASDDFSKKWKLKYSICKVYLLKDVSSYLDDERSLVALWFPGGSAGKESACTVETWVRSLGREDPLEKGKATHSSILVWRIPWTQEPDRLQSTGSQRVRHDWATKALLWFSLSRCLGSMCWIGLTALITPSSDPLDPVYQLAENWHPWLSILWRNASPSGMVAKNLPASAGDARDASLISGSGRSPGEGNGNSLQYSCLENSIDKGAWWATVHEDPKSRTWLSTHATPPRAGDRIESIWSHDVTWWWKQTFEVQLFIYFPFPFRHFTISIYSLKKQKFHQRRQKNQKLNAYINY